VLPSVPLTEPPEPYSVTLLNAVVPVGEAPVASVPL